MRAPECCAVLRDEKVPVPRRHAALTTTRLFKVNGGHATTCSHHKVTQTTVPERASTHMRTSNKNHIPTVELCVCVPSPNVLHNPQTTHYQNRPHKDIISLHDFYHMLFFLSIALKSWMVPERPLIRPAAVVDQRVHAMTAEMTEMAARATCTPSHPYSCCKRPRG